VGARKRATVEYHPDEIGPLTVERTSTRQYQAGSLTGAVASQKVTEASNGSLSLVGNQAQEYKGRRELDGERHASSRDESRA
jgi:hypothetical protein